MTRKQKMRVCDKCEHLIFRGTWQQAYCNKQHIMLTYVRECPFWKEK